MNFRLSVVTLSLLAATSYAAPANEKTLDTLEVKKIDEAMANLTPPEELQTRESKREQLSKTTLKLKKQSPHYVIVSGKKYRIFKDNYLI